MHSTRPLTPRSFQRLHRALRRLVLQRIFAAFAPGADFQKPEGSDEQIFRLTASPQDFIAIPRAAAGVNFCEGIVSYGAVSFGKEVKQPDHVADGPPHRASSRKKRRH
jgi:hypothetical protein